MGRGNQFFRVGARLRFKTRGERIRRALQDSAGRGERAFAVFQSAAPMCACIALHELFCSSNEIEELYTGAAASGSETYVKMTPRFVQWLALVHEVARCLKNILRRPGA